MATGRTHRALAALLAFASAAAAPAAPSPPSLRIARFSGNVERSTVRDQVGPVIGAPTSARIALGEEIVLGWSIDVCRMQAVRIELSGLGDQPPGPRHEERDGCYRLAGQRPVRPQRTTVYRLSVSGTTVVGAGAAPAPVSAQFEVRVARPVLEAVEPLIDQGSLRITFRARNRGEADLVPSPVNVAYGVRGVVRGPWPLITEGRLRADRVAIARGQTVELGSITLPDRRAAFSYDNVTVSVSIDPEGTPDLEAATGSFPYRWTPRTMTLTTAMLRTLGRVSSCRIRLNNYNPAGRPEPVAANDSFVVLNLAGTEILNRFDIPPTRAVVRLAGSFTGQARPERVYGIFIRQIVTQLHGRDDFFSIQDGKLVIRLVFPNAAGGEVKIGEVTDGVFRDDQVPDVGIGPFSAEMVLTPGLTSDLAHLTFVRSAVEVSALAPRLDGHPEALDPFIRDTLKTSVRDSIVGQLNAVLARPDIKRAFEVGFAGLTSIGDLTVIRRVEGRGEAIVVTYL